MEMGNMLFGNSRGEFPVDRAWEGVFLDFLEACDIEDVWYDNGVFTVRPYYWGEDDEMASLPNFEFKSNGFELSWYKRPLRDAYMNQDISFSEFERMLSECMASFRV